MHLHSHLLSMEYDSFFIISDKPESVNRKIAWYCEKNEFYESCTTPARTQRPKLGDVEAQAVRENRLFSLHFPLFQRSSIRMPRRHSSAAKAIQMPNSPIRQGTASTKAPSVETSHMEKTATTEG